MEKTSMALPETNRLPPIDPVDNVNTIEETTDVILPPPPEWKETTLSWPPTTNDEMKKTHVILPPPEWKETDEILPQISLDLNTKRSSALQPSTADTKTKNTEMVPYQEKQTLFNQHFWDLFYPLIISPFIMENSDIERTLSKEQMDEFLNLARPLIVLPFNMENSDMASTLSKEQMDEFSTLARSIYHGDESINVLPNMETNQNDENKPSFKKEAPSLIRQEQQQSSEKTKKYEDKPDAPSSIRQEQQQPSEKAKNDEDKPSFKPSNQKHQPLTKTETWDESLPITIKELEQKRRDIKYKLDHPDFLSWSYEHKVEEILLYRRVLQTMIKHFQDDLESSLKHPRELQILLTDPDNLNAPIKVVRNLLSNRDGPKDAYFQLIRYATPQQLLELDQIINRTVDELQVFMYNHPRDTEIKIFYNRFLIN